MINPLENRVLASPRKSEETVTPGGLHLLSNADERGGAVLADLVAVGPECTYLHVGDLVLLSQYIGDKVEFKHNFFVIVEETSVLATIDRDDEDREEQYYAETA
jgi:co-chaperonin GroES (HSP10)